MDPYFQESGATLPPTVNGVVGAIKFCVESDEHAVTKEKPFIRIRHDTNVERLSNFVISLWCLQPPDIVISIISGNGNLREWKKAEYQDTFQRGFARLFRTVSAWVFDDGYNHGIGKIIGAAVKEEEDRRLQNAVWKGRYKRFQNVVMPKIVAVSMPLVNDLGNARQCIDAVVPSADAGGDAQIQFTSQPLMYNINDQTVRESAYQYDIEPFHTHYMLIDGTADAQQVANLRCCTIRAVHMFANLRHGVVQDRERMQSFLADSGSSSDEDGHAGTITNDSVPATPAITVDGKSLRASEINRIPLVAMCIQGGPEQLEQILYFLERDIPVIVVNGSGFLADLVAAMFHELYADGNTYVDRNEMRAAKNEILLKFRKWFPRNTQLNQVETADRIFDQFCAIMCGAVNADGRRLISVLDLRTTVAKFSSLEDCLLNTIMSAEDCRNSTRSLANVQAKLKIHLLLCVKWNADAVAQKRLLSQSCLTGTRSKLTALHADVFEMALVLKHRHKFIDMFLERNFKVHRYLSHRRLLVLFRRAEDTEFFQSVVFEGLLNQPADALPDEKFVCVDLPKLVRTLTGTSQIIDAYQLTSNAFGLYSVGGGAVEAERKARLALLVWAVLMNRFDLAVTIWRHCDDPVPTALFVSHMFNSLSKVCAEPEISDRLQRNSEAFGDLAYNVFDSGYNDAAVLAFELLEQNYADFQNKTPLLMAYEAHNKKFLIHPCCQKWLQLLYYGRMNVHKRVELRFAPFSLRRWLNGWVPESVKVLSAAWLILPMFIWISFPFIYAVDYSLLGRATDTEEENGEVQVGDEKKADNSIDKTKVFDDMNTINGGGGGGNAFYFYADEGSKIDDDELLLAESYKFGPEIIVPRRQHHYSFSSNTGASARRVSFGIQPKLSRSGSRVNQNKLSKRTSTTSSTATDVNMSPTKRSRAVSSLMKQAFAAAQLQQQRQAAFETFYADGVTELAPPVSSNDSMTSPRSNSDIRPMSPISLQSINTGIPTPVLPTLVPGTNQAELIEVNPNGSNSLDRNSISAQPSDRFLSVPASATTLGPKRPSTQGLVSSKASIATKNAFHRRVSDNSSRYPMLIAAKNGASALENHAHLKSSNLLNAEEELARIADIQRGYYQHHHGQSNRIRFAPSNSSYGSVDAKSASLSLWEKVHYVWTAPITKHYSYCLWHILFLITYSVAALVPSCDTRLAFALDSVVWLWTLAIGVELTVRTLKQSDRGHPIYLSNRLVEITFIFALLATRMALRIMDATDDFMYEYPMLPKAIALIGLLYFFIRIIFDFMPLSRTLGPWLFKFQNMVRYGFVLYIMLILPYLGASMIVIQASLYPDKPFSFDSVLQAAERIFMSFFTTPIAEVTSITPQCKMTQFNMWHQPNASQACMAGSNADSECPTGSVWSYFFMFQFLFIFKIVLSSLVFGVFGVYMYINNEITNVHWRFHRYRRLIDFETRCAIPPPFSLIPHCAWMLRLLWYGLLSSSGKFNDTKLRNGQQTPSTTLLESPQQPFPLATARIKRLMCRSNYWKALANAQWVVWNAQRQKEKPTGVADELAATSAALSKISEELKQLKIAMKRWKPDGTGARECGNQVINNNDNNNIAHERVLPKLVLPDDSILAAESTVG